MKFATLKKKVIASAFAQIDRMSADELLDYVSRKELPSTERNPDSGIMIAKRYAFARLDLLTR